MDHYDPTLDPENIYHRWRYYDPIRKRMLTARFEASEAHARTMVERGEWIDPQPVPGTRCVRLPTSQDQWDVTGGVLRGPPQTAGR